jgi:hypothetical protein
MSQRLTRRLEPVGELGYLVLDGLLRSLQRRRVEQAQELLELSQLVIEVVVCHRCFSLG